MLPIVARSLLAGGACYAFTEGCRYLCTRPTVDLRVADLFDRMRITLAEIRNYLAHEVGEIIWSLASMVVFENAWVSTFVISYLYMSQQFIFTGTVLQLAALSLWSVIIAMYSCIFRVMIAEFLPSLALWIAEIAAPQQYPVDAGQVVRYVPQPQSSQERSGQVADLTPYSLTRCNISDLPDIPEELHQDPLLSHYICPITCAPIRDPVRDPNGRTLYERRAIYSWLREKLTSPITRAPLFRSDLQELPRLKEFIEDRLKMYQERLKIVVEKGGLEEALAMMLLAPANKELARRAAVELTGVAG